MTLTICTHPQRCTDTDTAYANVCGQLADAWREVAQLKAQLQQAQDATSRLQDALQQAQDGYNVYYGMYKDLSAKEARR